MGQDAMILVFWMLSFKPTFPLFSFTFIKRLFSSSLLSAIGWCHLHIWGYCYFSQQFFFNSSVFFFNQFIFYWRIIALQNFTVFCQTSKWVSHQFSCSVVSNSLQPHESQHARPPCPSPFAQIHVHRISGAIQPYHPLLSPILLPSVVPSIRVFSKESVICIRWPKYWSFSFNISPSNEYSGLISFRIDRLDILVVQGTLKSLLQHHSSKPSILRSSA